ncbi:hypothetical protein FORC14_1133 [Vibrio parahaemolyticus]|nr:hypothetical protein FORC14_1133 [Vibrio parahaemolyticus]
MKIDINNQNISNLNTQESMRGSEIVKIKQVRQLGLGNLQTKEYKKCVNDTCLFICR